MVGKERVSGPNGVTMLEGMESFDRAQYRIRNRIKFNTGGLPIALEGFNN
jgi:hypothetical protein